jgi:hypothetical protein
MRHRLSQKHSRTNSRGGHGADASKTGMGRKTEFSRLGLLGMRMGVQPFMAARWQIHRRDEDEIRTAARQGVRISRLCRAPESHKETRLAKSLTDQMLCDSRVHAKQLPFKDGY